MSHPRSSPFIRLILAGLISAALTLGFTTTGAQAAPPAERAAPTQGCVDAQAQDQRAASKVEKKQKKFKKAKKAVKKAKKAVKKSSTAKRQKALKKAKAKKKKAKKQLRKATTQRTTTANRVAVFCGTNPDGSPAPPTTPGVSPLAPLCVEDADLQPLCDATESEGSTSPLLPLCEAIPELAPLCAVAPGDVADPAALQALLAQIGAALPQGAALTTFLADLVTSLTGGELEQVAEELQTTPSVLAEVLRALGIPVPAFPI